jgi:hypothetical protein
MSHIRMQADFRPFASRVSGLASTGFESERRTAAAGSDCTGMAGLRMTVTFQRSGNSSGSPVRP